MRWLCTGGTRFATPRGDIAVEHLLPGMVLTSRDGAALVVGPIGRIRLSVAELLARPALWPVRVAAGDVLVLAEQPLGEPAIAAKWLVDGVALDRPQPHAPLDVFSLTIEAPGIPAALCLRDDAGEQPRPPDAVLFAARRTLAARAGRTPGPLLGSVDGIAADRLTGWADDGSGHPVALELVVNGVTAPPMLADQLRHDLAAAGIGDGRRGFMMPLNPPLDPRRRHLLRIRRALDGADLPGSPVLLDAVAKLAALLDALPDGAARRQASEAAARAVAARLAAHR